MCACVHAKLLQLCPTLCNPRDCCLPGSSVHGTFLQEYCSGLPFPSPGHLPNPGMEPLSLISSTLAGRVFFFTTSTTCIKNLFFLTDLLLMWIRLNSIIYLCVCVCVCVCVCACLVVQLCLTLCNPMDCNPPSSSVPGIFQARILEWVAISYSRVYQYVILVSLNQCNYLYISHFYFLACNLFGEEPWWCLI